MVTSQRFRDLVAASRPERDERKLAVAAKRWASAEPDKTRFRNFVSRRAAVEVPRGAESLVGDTVDLQGAAFLSEGAEVRGAVAYVEVNSAGRSSAGSGFLISPDLFLTNQHVIPDAAAARGTQIIFDREMDELGRPRPMTSFQLDPDRFLLLSPEDTLDYALVAVGERLSGSADIDTFGYIVLSNRGDKHVLGMNVNIIQHPGGWPKMIAVRNNILTYRTPRTLLYETDTDHGSSGSPVFNDLWELVALHHYGEPFLEQHDELNRPIAEAVNEGVRISAIYEDLNGKLAGLDASKRALLGTALNYDRAEAAPVAKVLKPPRPAAPVAREAMMMEEAPAMVGKASDELRVVIPLEVSIRVGGGVAAAAPAAVLPEPPVDEAVVAAPAKTLVRGAEKVLLDKDYSNRGGYDPGFISGETIPLPKPDKTLAKQVAPLQAEEPNPKDGELKYEHFSVKLNKAKRLAMFTATNIDGPSYLAVDRDTGLVKELQEGETWYRDPRISASFCLDQSFYGDWSTYFDRGHLTRRTDPTWGATDEEAERANGDTFHFTNCSPQHFRFNQSAKFWQGAERYVLERGVLSTDARPKLTVFQGPIFADAIDRWADDVQIPSSFFKVIVWKTGGKLKSVGLVVDQADLLDEPRTFLGMPKDVPVNVKQWRLAIKTIEDRTGLDFGKNVRDADTIKLDGQLTVGEAQKLVTSMDDLLPSAAESATPARASATPTPTRSSPAASRSRRKPRG